MHIDIIRRLTTEALIVQKLKQVYPAALPSGELIRSIETDYAYATCYSILVFLENEGVIRRVYYGHPCDWRFLGPGDATAKMLAANRGGAA